MPPRESGHPGSPTSRARLPVAGLEIRPVMYDWAGSRAFPALARDRPEGYAVRGGDD